jgi:hypothetical protein
MYKLFTVQEAKELIPVVDRHLRDMQDAIEEVSRGQGALETARPLSITARNLQTDITFSLVSLQDSKAELDRLGVFLKDVDAGVIDFPSQVGAEVVYLSWRQGEPTITHYHRVVNDQALPLAPVQG